jgi:hypothetical protein
MKKLRMILSAFIVFAIVGSALAFKAVQQPNILFCNDQNICEEQELYSSFEKGDPIPVGELDFKPFIGVKDEPCGDDPKDDCHPYEDPFVWEND